MSARKGWSEAKEEVSPEVRQKGEAKARRLIEGMTDPRRDVAGRLERLTSDLFADIGDPTGKHGPPRSVIRHIVDAAAALLRGSEGREPEVATLRHRIRMLEDSLTEHERMEAEHMKYCTGTPSDSPSSDRQVSEPAESEGEHRVANYLREYIGGAKAGGDEWVRVPVLYLQLAVDVLASHTTNEPETGA